MIVNLAGINARRCIEPIPGMPDDAGYVVATLGGGELGWVAADALSPHPYRMALAMGGDSAAVVTDAHLTFRAPDDITLTALRASLYTESATGAVEVDLLVNGVSILSTTLTIDEGERTSTTAATPAVISTPAIADDDEVQITVIDGGSGAMGLVVMLIGEFA